jgi:tetratricopeptide (TPR) repeat protein
MRKTMAYALIRSSRFSSTAWRSDAIERAEKIAANLLTPDSCLETMIITQKIIQNRSSKISEVIDDFSGFSLVSEQLNALCGQLCLTRSNMHLQNEEDIDAAFALLQKIHPINQNNISTMEELVLQQKALSLGRLLRFQGRFEDARSLLEAVYDARKYPEGVVSVGESDCELLSQLAETYCELGNPVKAEMLVSAKLESIFEKTSSNINLGQYKNDILRLVFAQAEAALQQGEYWRAFDLYRDMNRYIWSTRGRQSWFRAVCRMHMGLARVHHLQGEWSFALKYWERALRMYEKHPDSQDFGTAVTYASIAYVKVQLTDMEGARSFAVKAQELFKITGRQHWYTGLGSVWHDEMLSGLKDVLKTV